MRGRRREELRDRGKIQNKRERSVSRRDRGENIYVERRETTDEQKKKKERQSKRALEQRKEKEH